MRKMMGQKAVPGCSCASLHPQHLGFLPGAFSALPPCRDAQVPWAQDAQERPPSLAVGGKSAPAFSTLPPSLAVAGLMCVLALFSMQVALADDTDIIQVKKALESVAPGAKADSITAASLPGLYEVTVGAEVVYISKDGRYMLQGDLVDLQTQKNLTEAKRGTGRLKLVNAVSESNMIIFSPNNRQVKHTITVFTDVDCAYCRKMHSEMAELNRQGIKVRYLMFPRAGRNSASYDKAVSVFCSKDRNAALTRAKATGNIEKKTCANPVDQHMTLVERLGLTGTPTLMLEDGRLLPGYVPAQRLSKLLDGNQS